MSTIPPNLLQSDDNKRALDQIHSSSSSSSSSSAMIMKIPELPIGWEIIGGSINTVNPKGVGGNFQLGFLIQNTRFKVTMDETESQTSTTHSQERKNLEESSTVTVDDTPKGVSKVKYILCRYKKYTRKSGEAGHWTEMFVLTEKPKEVTGNCWEELYNVVEGNFTWKNKFLYERDTLPVVESRGGSPVMQIGFRVDLLYQPAIESLFQIFEKHHYMTKEEANFFKTIFWNAIRDPEVEAKRKAILDSAADNPEKALSDAEALDDSHEKMAIEEGDDLMLGVLENNTSTPTVLYIHQERILHTLAMTFLGYKNFPYAIKAWNKYLKDYREFSLDPIFLDAREMHRDTLLSCSKGAKTLDEERKFRLEALESHLRVSDNFARPGFIPFFEGLTEIELDIGTLDDKTEKQVASALIVRLVEILSEHNKKIKSTATISIRSSDNLRDSTSSVSSTSSVTESDATMEVTRQDTVSSDSKQEHEYFHRSNAGGLSSTTITEAHPKTMAEWIAEDPIKTMAEWIVCEGTSRVLKRSITINISTDYVLYENSTIPRDGIDISKFKYIGFRYDKLKAHERTIDTVDGRGLAIFFVIQLSENALQNERDAAYQKFECIYEALGTPSVISQDVKFIRESLIGVSVSLAHLEKQSIGNLFNALEKQGYITKPAAEGFRAIVCNLVCNPETERERKEAYDLAIRATKADNAKEREIYARGAINLAQKLHDACSRMAERLRLFSMHCEKRPVYVHQEIIARNIAMLWKEFPVLREETIEISEMFLNEENTESTHRRDHILYEEVSDVLIKLRGDCLQSLQVIIKSKKGVGDARFIPLVNKLIGSKEDFSSADIDPSCHNDFIIQKNLRKVILKCVKCIWSKQNKDLTDENLLGNRAESSSSSTSSGPILYSNPLNVATGTQSGVSSSAVSSSTSMPRTIERQT